MSGPVAWVFLAYLVIAAFFCVMTWIDVSRTHYVYNPPSGILTGAFWPLVVLACAVMWWMDPMRPKLWRRT